MENKPPFKIISPKLTWVSGCPRGEECGWKIPAILEPAGKLEAAQGVQ